MTLSASETERLQSRIDRLVDGIGDEYGKQTVARALVAKACNVSLAASGSLATMWMLEHASNLMGGRWGPDSIKCFIETKR
jgi:hypothetical protein